MARLILLDELKSALANSTPLLLMQPSIIQAPTPFISFKLKFKAIAITEALRIANKKHASFFWSVSRDEIDNILDDAESYFCFLDHPSEKETIKNEMTKMAKLFLSYVYDDFIYKNKPRTSPQKEIIKDIKIIDDFINFLINKTTLPCADLIKAGLKLNLVDFLRHPFSDNGTEIDSVLADLKNEMEKIKKDGHAPTVGAEMTGERFTIKKGVVKMDAYYKKPPSRAKIESFLFTINNKYGLKATDDIRELANLLTKIKDKIITSVKTSN